MSEEPEDNSKVQRLMISAGVAILIHALVYFSWTKVSVEQTAYAIGSKINVEMTLSSEPLAVSESEKVPEEEKKNVVVKSPEKKLIKAMALIEAAKQNIVASLAHGQKVTESSGETMKEQTAAEPDYLNNPPPKYPTESRRRHEEGVVSILASINSAGKVETLKLSTSSGFERLDDAALKAVKDWKFRPAKLADIAVDSSVEIPVRFSLR